MRAPVLSLLIAASIAAFAPGAAAQQNFEQVYKLGMASRNAGMCDEAIEYLETALSLDPSRIEVRVPLSECYHEIGMTPVAIQHIEVYLQQAEAGVERSRAERLHAMYLEGEVIAPASQQPEPEPASAPIRVVDHSTESSWPLILADVCAGAGHVATSYEPTFAEILGGVRVFPFRMLSISAHGGLGAGGMPDVDGALFLPQVRISAGFAPPIRPMLLSVGPELLLFGSEQAGEDVIDAGLAVRADVRVPIGEGPLFIGGGVSVGQIVGLYVAGHAGVGINVGPGSYVP